MSRYYVHTRSSDRLPWVCAGRVDSLAGASRVVEMCRSFWRANECLVTDTLHPLIETPASHPAPAQPEEADPLVWACPDGARCSDPDCLAENARRATVMP